MQTFQQELARTLLDRCDGDLSQYVVLFPSLRARTFFNDAVAQMTDRPVWQPSWMSIDELMERGSGLVRGERIRLISELYKIYVKHHPSESFDRFYFWGDMLISDFDMIDKYLVDASMLLRNINDIKEIEADLSYLNPQQERILRFWSAIGPEESLTVHKRLFLKVWNSLPAIYNEYREHLRSIGIGYPGMIYRETAERIIRGEEIDIPDKHFIIAGFNALSKSEDVLFKYLSKSSNGAEFFWDYDGYYVGNDSHEAGMFLRGNLATYGSAEGVTHDNFTGQDKHLRATACVSNIVQVKHVAAILDALPEEELDKRTAIVLTDENMLIPLLHALPERVKSVNVTMGYPLKTTLAYSLVEHLIALQAHSRQREYATLYYHQDVSGILSHPYIVDCCGGRAAHYASLITKNRMTSVDGAIFHEERLLSDIFGCKYDSWHELSKYIINVITLLIDMLDTEDIAQREYLRVVMDEVRKVELSIVNCGIEPSIEVFTSLLRRHLQTLTVPFEGEPLEGIQIMGILETRNIDFKNVIILSMTDANFPGDRTEQSSFMPYSLRLAYGLPTPEQHEAMYAYYFYRLIQRAERVDMLYCSRADDKSTGERSRYIYQLDYESPFEVKKRSVGVDLGVSGEQPMEVVKGDKELSVLARYLDAENNYSLSPTSLSRYIECPMKFYYHTVAHLRTPDELGEKIDALTFGNILHEALQALYDEDIINTKNPAERIKAITEERVETIVDAVICKLLQGGRRVDVEDFSGDTLLVRDIIIKYIMRGIMRYDAERDGYTIVGLEKDVEYSYPISCGREVKLSGRADRIDRLADGTLQIIDYKSSRRAHLECRSIADLFTGAALDRVPNIIQTLLYAMMLHRRDGVETMPSLFFVTQMLSGDYQPTIVDKSTGAVIERYSDVAEEFEAELSRTLEELFDPATPFRQTEDEDACTYCDFKKICRR